MTESAPEFDDSFRQRFIDLLRWRRDVRRFRPDPVDPALLEALLDAACLAPSVGYSQPWRFVAVETAAARAAVQRNFEQCNAEALAAYRGERAQRYAALKLEGLREAPVQLAVFTHAGTATGHGLGRRTMPATLDYSTVMAIQTFWLAARAAGVGVGWVSILDPGAVARDLDVPGDWSFTAYLCIGYPQESSVRPELRRLGWEQPDPECRRVLVR